MAYNALNNLIDAYIYANGVQAITGQILNGVLKQMVSQLGSGYHLMGVAGPETTPASNDFAMAYFAATAGEYTDFGGITLTAGEVAVLLTSGNGSWEKQTIYNVPTGTADLENTANFITNAVADLVNYYTKTEVDDTLANYPTLEALATALADYYDKSEIDAILAGYTTNTALASALADYYNKNDIDGLLSVVNAALADRYTKSETDTKLADYYRKAETYDKDEVDSIVAALSRQEYIVAWDGLAAPDVSAIPSGVTVTYSGTPYTGTLAASASTVNKIYMVWNGTAYDMYGTSQDGGYSWVPMGTTSVDLSQYATKAEVSQLEHEVDEKFYGMVEQSLTIEQGAIASATGEDSTANNRIRTNGYIISTIIKVNITSGKYYVFGYDEDGYVGAATNGWKTISDTITKEGCSKYRIVFAKSNDANLGPSDFASLGVTVWAYDGTKKEVVLEDDIIDNVFTNDNKKPLSAAAGHRLFEKYEKGNSVFASALNNIVGAFDASKLVTWNEGKLWNCTTGKKNTLSNYKCSEPIDITGVTKVVVTGAATVDADHRPIAVYVDGVYSDYRSGTVLAEDFSYNSSLAIVINAASATDVKVEFQSQSSIIDEAIEPINDKVSTTVAFTGNLFLVGEDGYITPSGSGTGTLSGSVNTPLVKVNEGDIIHYKGGWQSDDEYGLVWGYADKDLSVPVKLVNAVSNYDDDIVVPSGVAYMRAWSLVNKEPVFELQTSINTRLSGVEGMLPSLEKVGIDEDCTNLATDVPSTTSGSRKYIIINNKPAGVDGVVSQIKFSSLDSNLRFYVIVCELNLDGTKATIKSRYLITETGAGTHTKAVNIPIKQGQYLGVQGTGVEGDYLPSYGSTKTNGWYWNSNGSALVYRVEANVSYLQYYSVAFGYKITVDNYEKIPKFTTIVAERNNADYNSIREIMESITDASESNRYIIKIPKGRWFECDIVGKDYVSLVGEDMNDTIIYCDGTSDNLTPFDYSVAGNGNTALSNLPRADKHCINARADLDVEGLTIEATSCKYCVHIDNGGFKKARFKNCRFVVISDCLNPVGIGIRGSQTIAFDGCQFIGTGLKGAYVHNWNNQLDVCHISFQNCRFGSDYLTIGELGSEFSCFIELLNCYSDNQSPQINALVESHDGESYWIDPETGEPTSELTDVPYSIKLNAIGTSPFNLSQSNRENFLDYCIGKFN